MASGDNLQSSSVYKEHKTDFVRKARYRSFYCIEYVWIRPAKMAKMWM